MPTTCTDDPHRHACYELLLDNLSPLVLTVMSGRGHTVLVIAGLVAAPMPPKRKAHSPTVRIFKTKRTHPLDKGTSLQGLSSKLGLRGNAANPSSSLYRVRLCASPTKATLPLLGVATLDNSVMLTRLLDSIDMPVNDLVVVQNGDDLAVRLALEQFTLKCKQSDVHFSSPGVTEPWRVSYIKASAQTCAWPTCAIHRFTHFHNLENKAVAYAWNLILRYGWRQGASFVMIVDDDVTFAPGMIARFSSYVQSRLHEPDVLAHGGFFTAPHQNGAAASDPLLCLFPCRATFSMLYLLALTFDRTENQPLSACRLAKLFMLGGDEGILGTEERRPF